MDLGEILSILRSRWYIVVPMLVLALGLGGATYAVVPTTYSTYSMVSLLSAPAATQTATQGQDNPFLNFNGSLVATADFLGRRLQSTDTVLQLKSQGLTEKYEVALAENAQGPFLTLTLTGDDRAHLLASATQLAEFAEKTLRDIQLENGVSERDRIKLTQVIPPQKPKAETKEKLQPVIVVGGGTAALAFILVFIVESLSRARRRKALAAAGGPEKPAASGAASVTADIEGTMVIPLPPAPVQRSAAPVARPKAISTEAEKTQRIVVPPRPSGTAPAEKPKPPRAGNGEGPQSGRSGMARTYQSNGVDRRGQDVNRINGS
ncbi:hypothetical protein AB0G04_06645 [Actinoplanes sp. NPDC023801]|uniref:hypothetical protein n=1 Tax=Actinoplanes sp. NPDC023801 TaxID=3154595 RepID=UPI003403D697